MIESRIKGANKILKTITVSIFIAIAIILLTIGGLYMAGYKIVWVVGDSSSQSLDPYSLVLIQPCKVEDLVARGSKGNNKGDFAMRYLGSGYVTHEVVDVRQNAEGEWEFDTQAVGDRTTQTDAQQRDGKYFTQKDLAGKVVLKESLLGKLLAWVQGYPSLETSLAGGPYKSLAAARILTLAVILYGLTKFADFMYYKEELY